jgi:hypothetical protein
MGDFHDRLTVLSSCLDDVQDHLVAYRLPPLPAAALSSLDPVAGDNNSGGRGGGSSIARFHAALRPYTAAAEKDLGLLRKHASLIAGLALGPDDADMPIAAELQAYEARIAAWVAVLSGRLRKLQLAGEWAAAVERVCVVEDFVRRQLHRDHREGSSAEARHVAAPHRCPHRARVFVLLFFSIHCASPCWGHDIRGRCW